ncbi:MAG: DUF4838 domain-containing protein [Ruminococcaceae bacterium]|nr:DUF4838 domain-containing protein [Oscillospiraceae bacterium]
MNIYIAKLASVVEQNAAKELSTWLQKACGAEFPILSESEACSCCPGIYVGFTDFAASHGVKAEGGRNSLGGVEAWVIRAVEGSLVLTGGNCNTDRGIVYAVEHYLEDVIGIRFWNALEEYVPAIPEFSIDPTLNLSGEPEQEMRMSIACSFIGDDKMFAIRRRENYIKLPDEWGGCVTCSPRGWCHTINYILPRSDEQFREHPEWYAWSDRMNKRISYGQYCLNNEEFLQAFEKAFIDDIARFYAEADAKGEARPHHFHISMEDHNYNCECPKCKEVVAKSGGTGNVLRFVNRMARAAEKVYPGILVETLVYQSYMELPLDDTVPAPNVIIRLADIEIDILHGLNHPNNAHVLDVLKGWSAICKKGGNPLTIWDYNCSYTQTFASNIYRLAENFRTYTDYGVTGQFVEHEEPLISDFWCLKNWLMTHQMEDSRVDDRALIADFMEKYYGAAAPYLTRWIEITEELSANSPLRMRCIEYFTKADHVTYDAILEGNRLFDEAEAAVQYDEVLTRRVRQARVPIDVAIIERYDTLLYVARHRGETLPFDRQTSGLRYALTIAQTSALTEEYRKEHPDTGAPYWEGSKALLFQQQPHKAAPIPAQFADTDALQIPMHDYIFLGSIRDGTTYIQDPDAALGVTMQRTVAASSPARQDAMKMYPRGTDNPHFMLTLRHRGQDFTREFYLDEVEPDQYKLYHLFDIDDLGEDSNTMMRIVFPSMHISGFARDLPTGKIAVWASMKFSGAAYGGSAEIEDAIAMDRMFLVPRD